MKSKMSFKSSGLFLHTNNMVFNPDAILETQTKTLDLIDGKSRPLKIVKLLTSRL